MLRKPLTLDSEIVEAIIVRAFLAGLRQEPRRVIADGHLHGEDVLRGPA